MRAFSAHMQRLYGLAWGLQMRSETLTVEQLKEWLDYSQETGVFRWKKSPRFNVPAGAVAGHQVKRGHPSLLIGIGGRYYGAHRLAWLFVTGEWPRGRIDHLNGVPSENWFLNLRDATLAVNAQNRRRATRASKTGVLGVSASTSKSSPFRAQITVNGRTCYIGVFATPEAAYDAYVEKKRQVHEGCTL